MSIDKFSRDLENIPLPIRWKNLMKEKYLEEINDTDSLEELRYVHLKWHPIIRGSNKIYESIRLLDAIGAGTVKQLVLNHFFIQNVEPTKTESETLERELRRNLDILFLNCLVNAEKIPPVKGKRGTTLWFTHFVKDKRVERAKELYLVKGGDLWTAPKTEPKTPEQVMDHNAKVSDIAKDRKKKNLVKDTVEAAKQKEIAEAVKPSYHVMFKCTKCGNPKKVQRAMYKKYKQTGDKTELIGAFFKAFDQNIPGPCLCGNNEWIRTSYTGDDGGLREVIKLDLKTRDQLINQHTGMNKATYENPSAGLPNHYLAEAFSVNDKLLSDCNWKGFLLEEKKDGKKGENDDFYDIYD